MIVAVYVKGLTILQPVYTVNRIERLTPQERQSRNTGEEANSFASMLKSMTHPKKGNHSNGFE